jgi:hypothetical protein
MAKIQIPQAGQPLDVSYISEMASALNDLQSLVSPNQSKYLTIDTSQSGTQTAMGKNSRFIGGYVEIKPGTVTGGEGIPFTYSFSSAEFKYPPIVTATVVNKGNTVAGKDTYVILYPASTSKVDGVVKFDSTGNVIVGVNLIIIGITN